MICPSCASDNRPGARFCDTCGAPLAPAPAARPAERRQLSVVFCDLVGSTALARSVDPEELREIIGRYQAAATDAVTALGGHTAIFLGDGILTYFGYPDAHEDDVERAVRAGLDIVRAVDRLSPGEGVPALAVRVAVHTGDVVVGDLAVAGAGIFGSTPNIAARLQDIAPPGGVVVSEATHRLTQGLFRVVDLGEHTLPGIEMPLRAYHVLGPSGVRSRFAGERRRRGPLVGRDTESGVLWDAWEQARTSAGRAVLIEGEAGVGKSRLVEAFHERLTDTVHTWLECAGTPYTRDSAFAPVIALQAAALRLTPEQTGEDKLRVLEAAVQRAGMPVLEAVPLLARLHSIPIPPESELAGALEGLGPDAIRRETKSFAGEWLLRIGRQQPVVLLVEDLHWLDPSSIELLGEILGRLAETRVLLVLTARPEFDAVGFDDVVPILLEGLDRSSSLSLARSVRGAGSLGDDEIEEIVDRTDGVPLFIEEMTRAAVDRDRDPRGDTAGLPATLKGLLMARIDRLGTSREVAQIGAALGRDFDYALLRAVWDKEPARLDLALERIVEEDLATRRGTGAEATYSFRHALIQEAAYQSLLRATRRSFHARIGEALIEAFPATAETRPELVAHHFTKAQSWERAIPLWATAGQGAARRSANVEAERHLRAGLACVEELPDGPERLQQELLFRTHLGANLISLRGYGAEEVAENIARAEALCELIGPSPFLFPVLYNVWVFHLVRGDPAAPRLARQLLELAMETDPERFLTWAHVTNAITAYWVADWERARRHAELCREHYRWHPETLALFGDDTGAYGYLYQGLPLWFLGRPEQAATHLDEALATAEEVGYAFTVAGIRAFRAQVGHFARRPERAADEASDAMRVSSAQGFPLFLATGMAHAGWARLQSGETREGFEAVRDGLALYRSTGARLNLHYLHSLVAEAHLIRGDWVAGLESVDEGMRASREQFDRYYMPELHRLRAELLAGADGGEEAVAAALAQALALAAKTDSRMLELRAAVSLHRLSSQETARRAARERVASVYSGFSEGFQEPDLEAARRILEG